MQLPGAAWTALALALTGALGGWLDEYIQEPWVPLLVLSLNFVASAVKAYFDMKQENEALVGKFGLAPEPVVKSAVFKRALFG